MGHILPYCILTRTLVDVKFLLEREGRMTKQEELYRLIDSLKSLPETLRATTEGLKG